MGNRQSSFPSRQDSQCIARMQPSSPAGTPMVGTLYRSAGETAGVATRVEIEVPMQPTIFPTHAKKPTKLQDDEQERNPSDTEVKQCSYFSPCSDSVMLLLGPLQGLVPRLACWGID